MKWHSLEESTPGTDFRSLHAIFAERKELIARYVPPETQAVHARVIAELKRNNLAASGLAIGSKAPPFELNDQNGKPISSPDLLSRRSPGDLLFPRTLVSFLRRTTGSHESVPAPDRAGRSITGRNLASDSSTIVFHGRSAQAALSIVERRRKQGGPPVRPRLSRTPGATSDLPARLREPAFRERERQLGTSHPDHFHPRPRRYRALRLGR